MAASVKALWGRSDPDRSRSRKLVMSYYAYSFESRVSVLDMGRMVYRVVQVPRDVLAGLSRSGRGPLRIVGEINEFPYAGAVTPGSAGPYLLLSMARLREMGLKVGDVVDVRFNLDSSVEVALPEALETALAANAAAQAAWQALTPGRQRGLVHLVASAKRPETQAKRAADLVAGLLGTDGAKLPGPPSRRQQA